MIESQEKQRRWERRLTALTALCILAYLAVFAVINFKGFAKFCDPDMYADTLIAKMMWEQKTIFPQPWCFGNQYYVIATPVLAALFYGITGNTNTAMALATEVMTLLIFLSFFWMFRAISRNALPALLGCLMLMAAIIAPHGVHSRFGVLFFMQASYYACYIITMFVVFGDYLRTMQSDKHRPIAWGLSLVLSFATGMQSIRQTVVMVLPLLAYECFRALRRMILHEKFWDAASRRSLIRVLSYGAANGAGLVTIKLLHIPQVTIYGHLELASRQRLADSLARVWECFSQVTGLEFAFRSDYSVFFTAFCLIFLAAVVFAIVKWLSRLNRQEEPLALCWLLFLIGIGGVILASVLFNIKLRAIYIFMWFPLAAFSVLILLKDLSFRPRLAAAGLVCILSFANLCYSFLPDAGTALKDEPSDTQRMCQWAMEEGFEYIYGGWYTAPYTAAYSGGRITAGFWFDDIYNPLTYINALDIYDEEDNEKAVYIFDSQDRDRALDLARDRGVTLTEVAQFGDLTAYTSPVQLNRNPWE